MRHTQEAVILYVGSLGSEREVKKEKDQIMEGLKVLAQDFRLSPEAVERHYRFSIRNVKSLTQWDWVRGFNKLLVEKGVCWKRSSMV